jgi:hypothetical protein
MAKKTLKKMLEECTASPEADDSARRLATFLAYWDEIEDAYKSGWSWLQIHNALFQEGVIDYSYTTFMYYRKKKRRREMEAAKRESVLRNAEPTKPTPIERPARPPGSTKVELPVFKDVTRGPNDKRF